MDAQPARPPGRGALGAALRPLGASIEGAVLVVRFLEPDGRRIDDRWLLADDESYNALLEPDRSLESLASNFHEDVLTSQRGGPDSEGVRWFGDTA